MTESPAELAEEVASLRRAVNIYRALLLVALALLVFVFWRISGSYQVGEFGAAADVWTVDLADRLRWVEAEKARQADYSETYYASEAASVHMHFMGKGQTTPLHLHTDSHEATIIAGGQAEVTQYWGGPDGDIATRHATWPVSTLLASPPLCGHEWHNPDDDHFLANLVFTMPRFAGNLYVHPDDPRLRDAPPPTIVDPADGLDVFAASGDDHAVTRLDALDGRMLRVWITGSFTVPANLHKPVVGYVAAGSGHVRDETLRPQVLVHLENASPMTLEADPGAPLALVLFDPFGALSEG
jgi:hypothetical protein